MKNNTKNNIIESGSERGSAVIITLFFLSLMIVIALTMAYVTRVGKQVAINNTETKRAFYHATSGVERALAYLDAVAPLSLGKEENGDLKFNEASFSPAHFLDLDTGKYFFDENGIYNSASKSKKGEIEEIEFKIINHTGKFDPNWDRRPVMENNQEWNVPTFGLHPNEIDLRYLAGEELAKIFYDTSIEDRWIGVQEIQKQIYTSAQRDEVTLAKLPLIPHSPRGNGDDNRNLENLSEEQLKNLSAAEIEVYNALKNAHLRHANTFLERDGKIYERLDLATLRQRILSLPLGQPVMKNETAARAALDYLAFYHSLHLARIAELIILIKNIESEMNGLIANNFPDYWGEIQTIRNQITQINAQIHHLNLQTSLNQEYGNSSGVSNDHNSYLQNSNNNNALKKADLQKKVQELQKTLKQLVNYSEEEEENKKSQAIYDLILEQEQKIRQYVLEKQQHEYIRDAYLFWQENGIPTMENFHKKTISILTDNQKTPLPALTRILEYYYQNNPQAYLEFLSNLRDFFDEDGSENLKWDANFSNNYSSGYNSTTVYTQYLLPSDPFYAKTEKGKIFEKTTFPQKWGFSPSSLHNQYYPYCGTEIGPVLSDLRLAFVPSWRFVREQQISPEMPKVRYYRLEIKVYLSLGLMNPTSEYRYTQIGVNLKNVTITSSAKPSVKDQYYTTANSQTISKNYSQSGFRFNSSSDNKWLVVASDNPIATISFGEVQKGATLSNIQLTLEQIREFALYLHWAGVDGRYLTDNVKLKPNFSINLSLANLNLANAGENGDNEVATKAVVIDLTAQDPLCNTTEAYWNISSKIIDSFDDMKLSSLSRYSPIFIRNGLPWSLWELCNIHRAIPNHFLNLYSGEEKPDGSYEKGDWELLDQLVLSYSSYSKDVPGVHAGGEETEKANEIIREYCEDGKVNPNSQQSLFWNTLLSSVRLGKWEEQSANFPEIYPPIEFYPEFYQDFRAQTGNRSEEVGNQSLSSLACASMMADRTQTKPLMSRGRLALYYLDRFADINGQNSASIQRRSEILGKIIPLMQTRYQYFEIIATGRDCKELDEIDQTDGEEKTVLATYKLRVFVERDAYTGKIRPLTSEILE